MSQPGVYDRWWQPVLLPNTSQVFKSRGAVDKVITGPPPAATVNYQLSGASALTFQPPGSGRDALVYGSYDPASDPAAYVGVPAGTTLTRFPASGDGDFTVTANGQVIQDREIFGTVRLLAFKGVTIRRCRIWGTLATGTDTAFITGNSPGKSLGGALIQDCELTGRGSPWCSAMRDGDYTIERCHISNVSDGLCFTSPTGKVTAQGNWIHNGAFMEWDSTTPNMPFAGGFYTHVDGVQFHLGKDYTIRGNHIGGQRTNDPATGLAYQHHTGHAADINAGDDMYNSSFMIKQEVDATLPNKIERVLIEKNWLHGGTATVNHPSGNGNDFSSLTFRDNHFVRNVGGNQLYILKSPSLLATYTNNTFTDTGLPVPISNGGG